MAARDLDALFPGLAPATRSFVHTAATPSVLDLDEGPPQLLGEPDHSLGPFVDLWHDCWREPQRTLWTPCLAGALACLHEINPGLLSHPFSRSGATLLGEVGDRGRPQRFGDVEHVAVCAVASCALPAFRKLLNEEFVLEMFGIAADTSLAARLDQVSRWLPSAALPLPLVALVLGSLLDVATNRVDAFLSARRPFETLADRFFMLAEGQSVVSWEAALVESVAFWRDPRGGLLLRLLCHAHCERLERKAAQREKRLEARRAAAIPRRRLLQKLENQLTSAKQTAAALERQAAEWKRAVNAARREAAEARQARDRALTRLRVLECRLESEGNGSPADRVPAATAQPAPCVLSPAKQATAGDCRPAGIAPERVLAGRQVYLYTGQPRAAARREMARALERHGASCEVFDGNRLSELGPTRYDPEALVIIDTRQLCHAATEAIEERARVSGAWFYVGPAGQGSLAQRVAERWWKTHR